MTLVDTSVWVDHLRRGNTQLAEMLVGEVVACHPMVIGELACGNLKRRTVLLSLLHALPPLGRVSDDELLFFVEKHGGDAEDFSYHKCLTLLYNQLRKG